MPLFTSLAVLDELEPGAAAWNMAVDEALLSRVREPVLRLYRWREPSVSFGCFECYTNVAAQYPQHVLVRRWTGGGVVPHGADFTYSLIVPASEPLAKMRAGESYARLHVGIVAALQSCGFAAQLTLANAPKVSAACFENPVCADVLLAGKKIAGAAQRRTREGLLHQGSIQLPDLPPAFTAHLIASLSAAHYPLALSAPLLADAERLDAGKYRQQAWLAKY